MFSHQQFVSGRTVEHDQCPGSRKRFRSSSDAGMTSMVDVTFLLLIFFMVTASFTMQRSIPMPRRVSDVPTSLVTQPDPSDSVIELSIDSNGLFVVRTQAWERECVGKKKVVETLRNARQGIADADRLVVMVDDQARLQALVDGLDAGAIAGFEVVELTETRLL